MLVGLSFLFFAAKCFWPVLMQPEDRNQVLRAYVLSGENPKACEAHLNIQRVEDDEFLLCDLVG